MGQSIKRPDQNIHNSRNSCNELDIAYVLRLKNGDIFEKKTVFLWWNENQKGHFHACVSLKAYYKPKHCTVIYNTIRQDFTSLQSYLSHIHFCLNDCMVDYAVSKKHLLGIIVSA